MRIVIDTTESFSFFNEKSKARELSLSTKLDLHSPDFSLKEIKEHKSKIVKSFSLSESQFELINKLLNIVVKFSKEDEYSKFLSDAKNISPDPDDVDFFALALKLNCPIWSEEKLLKEQDKVEKLKKLKAFSSKIKLSDNDAKELADKISEAVADKFFKEAK